MHNFKRNQDGFSLIELLIVVAIILVIAAIAIPNLMSVRRNANESSAAQNMRTVLVAISQYRDSYTTVGYPAKLANLAPPASGDPTASNAAKLMDNGIACGTEPCLRSSYLWSYATNASGGTENDSFMILAVPNSMLNGRYSYCGNETSQIFKKPYAASDTATAGGCGGGAWVGL